MSTDTPGQAHLRFYGELNDFLPQHQRGTSIETPFKGRVAVKDLIEMRGVPHPEVDQLLANGVPVAFSYLAHDGDQIAAYPRHGAPALPSLVRPAPLPAPHFVLDAHLGKLATYLRMLGFDTLYRNDYDDPELARISSSEARILLTRDLGLLKRGLVTHGRFVRATDPWEQLREVLRHFALFAALTPFTRCVRCNSTLDSVDKAAICDRLEARTAQFYHDFRYCPQCDAVYWQGSHYQQMQRFVARIGSE